MTDIFLKTYKPFSAKCKVIILILGGCMAVSNERPPTGYMGNPATNKRMGLVRFATNAEITAGTANNIAVTPVQLNSVSTGANFASPPVLGYGSTTPRPVAATTITATTTIVAGTNITATNGNFIANTAGKGLQIKAGANARIGTATFVSGVATVANTSVTANTVILPVITALGTVSAPGSLLVTKNVGVGFTIETNDPSDTSTLDWVMFESI